MAFDFQPGSKIGEYVLDSYVGGGSFGAVWRGHDPRTGQAVAVKLLTGATATAESATARADVEVLAAAAASRSPHVVKVLGGGAEPVPYIVMELLEGQDLQTTLKQQGHLTPARTIEVGLAISDALFALQQVGIIHRDIKPANVMTDKDGVIKLADFGIAKIVGFETMTLAGQAAMTMAYAAPELWNDEGQFGKPSHKSDLYAMGVVLYQCLTGFTPFSGNFAALYKAHVEQAPDMAALPPDTPPSLRNLIGRCLRKRQEDRPRDADECRSILNRAEAELASASGAATVAEPQKLGPWIKDAPHDSVPWAWRCHHESTGQRATVEVHFADRLDEGERLRKAVTANAALTPLGAERLIESNRLLLHPTEAWWAPPPGEFQFWVAREDLDVVPRRGQAIGLALLRPVVNSLAALIGAAEARDLRLDLSDENVNVLDSGRIYVRRPGLVNPAEEPRTAVMAYLRRLPLDAEARSAIDSVTNLADLQSRLNDLAAATTIVTATQIVPRPVAAAPAAPPPPPVEAAPVAAQAPVDQGAVLPPLRPRAPAAPPAPPAKKGPPFLLFGGALGGIAIVALLVYLAFGNRSSNDGDSVKLTSGTQTSAATAPAASATLQATAVGQATTAPTVAPTPPPAVTTAGATGATSNPPPTATTVPERRIDTVLVEALDTQCSDGATGCRLVYSVGPFHFRGNDLRIDYVLQVVAPDGNGINWIDDITYGKQQAALGGHGTQVVGASGTAWPLIAAGGIAGQTNPKLPAGRYTGYWEFTFNEAAGTSLVLQYPDFSDLITFVVPP